jgi:hemoglobin
MTPWHSIGKGLAAGVLALAVAGCAQQQAMKEKPLYERLGGLPAIQAVIDDFVANVAADARINKQFAQTDIPRFKKNLVDQVCEATGGPCKYTGLDMKTAHKGMKITDADFTALVQDLVKSLDKFKVPAKEKNELLTALASMKPDIVGQ